VKILSNKVLLSKSGFTQITIKNGTWLYCAILMSIIWSCSPKIQPTVLQLTTRQAIVIQNKCLDHQISGLFGETGSVQCEDMLLEYIFGQNIDPGPLTPQEEFSQQFRGYYYQKFFEKVYLDEKVYKIFIDSVKLLAITPYSDTTDYLFNCASCNASARLKFKNKIYNIPYSSSVLFPSSGIYTFSVDTTGGYERKIFISKEPEIASGVFFKELKDKKSSSKLMISTAKSIDREKLLLLFRQIRVVKTGILL